MSTPEGAPPLFQHLRAVQRAERASFHMPGHKGGSGAPALGLELFGAAIYEADLSEMGGFDYLHHPESALLESQARAAALLGAKRSWFLVNGATVGNLAAILATVGEGDALLVARGSHRSVYAGLALSGARPIYLPPVAHDTLDGLFGIDLDEMRRALADPDEIRAIHVTSPSYYGLAVDIEAVAKMARAAGIPLIVDEAHGTHFALHPRFPRPALSAGADLVVHSPHKTLGSLTQSSLLHHQGGLVDPGRVDGLLQMLQSSSPSALLLVSLDLALAEMASEGEQRWEATIELAEHVRESARAIEGLRIYGPELLELPGIAAYDPVKLVVDVHDLGRGAPDAAAWLAANRGIRPEFSDLRRMVFSLTTGDDVKRAELLVDSLAALAADSRGRALGGGLVSRWPREVPEMALTPRSGGLATSVAAEDVELGLALGRIAAEMVVPYPPGIPLLVPGEVISAGVLEAIGQLTEAGCRIVGMADPSTSTIRCLAATKR
jgi:arginine decarboxylase